MYLVEGLAWWNWPLTWWTDQLLSFSALTLLVGSFDVIYKCTFACLLIYLTTGSNHYTFLDDAHQITINTGIRAITVEFSVNI